jgi:hypothetical protein
MNSVKGPIVLGHGGEIPSEIASKIGLPFQATGFKATHMPEGIVIQPDIPTADVAMEAVTEAVPTAKKKRRGDK